MNDKHLCSRLVVIMNSMLSVHAQWLTECNGGSVYGLRKAVFQQQRLITGHLMRRFRSTSLIFARCNSLMCLVSYFDKAQTENLEASPTCNTNVLFTIPSLDGFFFMFTTSRKHLSPYLDLNTESGGRHNGFKVVFFFSQIPELEVQE